MKLSNVSIAAIEALTPEELILFESLICRTRFLCAFEHILKAREYNKEWSESIPKRMTRQSKEKCRKQIEALDIPKGYVCVQKFWIADSMCDYAHHIVNDAVRALYHMEVTVNTPTEQSKE